MTQNITPICTQGRVIKPKDEPQTPQIKDFKPKAPQQGELKAAETEKVKLAPVIKEPEKVVIHR